jgi:hypothetical protein
MNDNELDELDILKHKAEYWERILRCVFYIIIFGLEILVLLILHEFHSI